MTDKQITDAAENTSVNLRDYGIENLFVIKGTAYIADAAFGEVITIIAEPNERTAYEQYIILNDKYTVQSHTNNSDELTPEEATIIVVSDSLWAIVLCEFEEPKIYFIRRGFDRLIGKLTGDDVPSDIIEIVQSH